MAKGPGPIMPGLLCLSLTPPEVSPLPSLRLGTGQLTGKNRDRENKYSLAKNYSVMKEDDII